MDPHYENLKHRRLLEDARRKREDGIILFFTMFLSSLFLFRVGFGSSVLLIFAGTVILMLGIFLFMYEDSKSTEILERASKVENPPKRTVEREVDSTITDLLIEIMSYLMKK